ncbi:mandelate racemase/muconate lactonizing enzyme family protein [Asticcacaulis taihuensis]|uniref:mandelate racemase/muconate lactonizing enzyme family protein n=1 Tax=Asticcacaulis taihuensis TaxID=260084 RepID=UPI0026ED4E3A|nr:mandelate racemase/muconate lactonizing enzyme family protein [Asticcacaulis taihuensis]
MRDTVASIETFIINIPRDVPYLGAARSGEEANQFGYLVRKDNRTLYPTTDKSVIVKVTTAQGRVGWGETYGICAPRVVCVLIEELLAPIVAGRDPFDVQVIWEDLYDLMRVRGYHSGFYLDALAGIDIALWDLCGKIADQPLHKLLGGARRDTVPAYVSGLPKPTLPDRIALAKEWMAKGFNAFKIHAVMSADSIVADFEALRAELGPDVDLMVDLHWMFTPAEAISLIRALEPYRLALVEAPCKPEDVQGLAQIARASSIPIAAGEEWRTVFDARARLELGAVSILQPEMGHKGVTQFMRMARLGEAYHARIMPHATIGTGIFMAASLHAAATIQNLPYHEYQPSIFDRNTKLLKGGMTCDKGQFTVPQGPGHGVEPDDSIWQYVVDQ